VKFSEMSRFETFIVNQVFKENFRDPISLILGTCFPWF